MAADPLDREPNFLRRWAQRKLAAARETRAQAAPPTVVPVPPAPPATAEAMPANAPSPPTSEPTAPLPDVASLTFDSDFKAFLAPEVDERTRRAALRKLFSDPRFNVQDGLDVYIDDYTKFEPIPEDVLGKLAHARYLFDPPKTRVNAQGHVEDVVDVPEARADDAEAPSETAPPANTLTEVEPMADALPQPGAPEAELATPIAPAPKAPS